MGPSPHHLPPHTVSVILSLLNPLDALPQDLLSTPLRQRHHFLSLSPTDDLRSYLAWPSNSPQSDDRVENLLSALPSAHDIEHVTEYPTMYTFDGDAHFAHAQVPLHHFNSSPQANPQSETNQGLRLVFRWENGFSSQDDLSPVAPAATSGWKYHDAQLMPFPHYASKSPAEALSTSMVDLTHASTSLSTRAQQTNSFDSSRLHPNVSTNGHSFRGSSPDLRTSLQNSQRATSSDAEDDTYWNSYGQSSLDDVEDEFGDDPRAGVRTGGVTGVSDDEKAEDAYWAQYASVQGTADSTVPSPLPVAKRKLHNAADLALPLGSDTRSRSHSQSSAIDGNEQDYLARAFALGLLNGGEVNGEGQDFSHLLVQGVSPHDLALRLHNISPRPMLADAITSPSPAPVLVEDMEGLNDSAEGGSPLTEESSDTASLTLSPQSADPHSGAIGSTSALTEIVSPRPKRSHERGTVAALERSDRDSATSSAPTTGNVAQEVSAGQFGSMAGKDDSAIREAVKGMYRLWLAGRANSSSFYGARDDAFSREAFVDIVRDALTDI